MELNLNTLGASSDATSSCKTAWDTAMAAFALAGGGTLVVPTGNYLTPPSTGPFCLDMTADNVTVLMSPGARFVCPVGMPVQVKPILRVNRRKNIIIRGGTFDGNWGNSEGGVNGQDGINHATQLDPKNHGIQIRGCEQVILEDLQFRQCYGDAVWVGHGADPQPSPESFGIYVSRVRSDMSARNGISFAGRFQRAVVTDCHWKNVYSCAIDFEADGYMKDAKFIRGTAGKWWFPKSQIAVSVDAGVEYENQAEKIVFEGIDVFGTFLVQRAHDVHVSKCFIYQNWGGVSWAPVYIRFNCDRVTFDQNTIYDANLSPHPEFLTNQNPHLAAMQVDYYASGTTVRTPQNVTLSRNKVFCAGDQYGARVCGANAQLVENQFTLNGGRAIDILAEKPGMNVRLRGNRSNTTDHIKARFTVAANAMSVLDISDELSYAIDAARFVSSVFVNGALIP